MKKFRELGGFIFKSSITRLFTTHSERTPHHVSFNIFAHLAEKIPVPFLRGNLCTAEKLRLSTMYLVAKMMAKATVSERNIMKLTLPLKEHQLKLIYSSCVKIDDGVNRFTVWSIDYFRNRQLIFLETWNLILLCTCQGY